MRGGQCGGRGQGAGDAPPQCGGGQLIGQGTLTRGGGDDLAQIGGGAGGLGELGCQLWPVRIRAHARVDRVEEFVPACRVGAAPPDVGGGVALQGGLYVAGPHGVLPRSGETRVGVLHAHRGTEHGDFGRQRGIHGDQGPRPRGSGAVGPGPCTLANLVCQALDQLLTPNQIGAPGRVIGQCLRDGGKPAQHTDARGVRTGGIDAVIEDRGRVGGVVDAALGQRLGQQRAGIGTAERQDGQVAAQHRPGLALAETGDHLVGDGVQPVARTGAQLAFRGHAEGVVEHVGRGLQSRRGIFGAAGFGGGRHLGAVAGQRAGQDVDGGVGVGGLGGQQPVRIAFGGRQVQVVLVGGAGHRDIQRLAGECVRAHDVAGARGVAPTGGQPLGGVDGGRVAERDVLGDVVGGQRHDASAAQMSGLHAAIDEDLGDGVAVAVAHEIVAPDANPTSVLPGANGVSDAGVQLVGQHHRGRQRGLGVGGQPVVTGAGVERVDDVVGGGEQDAVGTGREVGAPRLIGHVCGGLVGADVHAVLIDVEADARRIGVVQREPGGGFGRRLEPHDLAEGQGVGGLGDVAQDTARRDGRQLAVVTDQTHAGALAQRVGDHRVQARGGGLSGLVDDDERVGSHLVEPVGNTGGCGLVRVGGEDVLVEGVGGGPEVLPEDDRRVGGGGQTDDVAARTAPRMS